MHDRDQITVTWRRTGIILAVVSVLVLLAWLARARLAAELAQAYFQSHGVASTVEIDTFGFSGLSGRFALGPAAAPDLSAERIELHFNPLQWVPQVQEVRLVNPVVRARLDQQGSIRLQTIQSWVDSLQSQQGRSRFVSDDLVISLQNLRVLLSAQNGVLDISGDIRLVDNLPVNVALRARPARLTVQGTAIDMKSASVTLDQSTGRLALAFAGSLQKGAMAAENIETKFDAAALRWTFNDNQFSATARSANLQFSADSVTAGPMLSAPAFSLSASNLSIKRSNDRFDGTADIALNGSSGYDIGTLKTLAAQDAALARAIRRNLEKFDLSLSAHIDQHGDVTQFTLTAPLTVNGASGARLQVPSLTLKSAPSTLDGSFQASLAGGGLPAVQLISDDMTLNDGTLMLKASAKAQFNYAFLRGASLSAEGQLTVKGGQYAFTPSACVHATLASFRPDRSDLATSVRGDVCAASGNALLSGDGARWTLRGRASRAAAILPLANVALHDGSGALQFSGTGGDFSGNVAIAAAQLSDRNDPRRFEPLLGSGSVSTANGIWRGRIAATSTKKYPVGIVTFTHDMARGTGAAHITTPDLRFDPEKLQPADLSPLLVAFRQADGTAAFEGDITWTRDGFQSGGQLVVDTLDFLSPLGQAHTIKTQIAFRSLLPPITAENQNLTVSRVDWTLPFNTINIDFSFSPTTVEVGKVETEFSDGHVAVGNFTINLADPTRVGGRAQLTSVALSTLVSASNLGSKIHLDSSVSGTIPFTTGPDGFRIQDAHLVADAPGHLSIDRSLWGQGGVTANAVQDFAFQALEYLAFDHMTADLRSVENGRLQIVFHIQGRSDPPKPQTADVPITDLINGSALQKSIPLPSGTPIDLTLDVSLNFDELLKSYAETWSKSINPQD